MNILPLRAAENKKEFFNAFPLTLCAKNNVL